ncbi:hypothetical protein TNCT_324471 [Trichonephila clavata]|uniref:Uncharacterized protein n=1 Tax=Trichonephila clavata TaxID=2740835 RepID=A0A8X6JP65_TRICU|nr:hypothetical protein TNCT_324471 [Trichonephila clavata]
MDRKRKHSCPNTGRGLGKRPRVQEDATDWFDEYCADFDYCTDSNLDISKTTNERDSSFEKSPSDEGKLGAILLRWKE